MTGISPFRRPVDDERATQTFISYFNNNLLNLLRERGKKTRKGATIPRNPFILTE